MTDGYLEKLVEDQKKATEAAKGKCIEMYGSGVLHEIIEPTYNETSKTLKCPAFWDTILCWPDTPAGVQVNQSCPFYIAGFLESSNATRQCLENGTWYLKNNRTWSNYTSCYKDEILTIYLDMNITHISDVIRNYIPIIKIVSETGYTVSFATSIIAFAIMLFIKKLHCARNILHMHLFASFIFRALTFIIIKSTFVRGVGLPSDLLYRNGSIYFYTNSETNNWGCKLLISLWQYFAAANYSWILMEGLYLHNLIFRALFADPSDSIKWYVIMGWGLPFIITGAWVTARLLVEDYLCWTTHENYNVFLIIGILTMVSNLINLLLFIRISMVLYSKLRSPINEDSRRYLKWVKSTLVLVPLLGVHYALFLVLYYPGKTNDVVEVVWLFCDLLFGSFQGFLVAILYCFLNGEVKSEIQPHLYYFLTYLATNKYSKCLFPCRKRFLRFLLLTLL